MELENSNLLAHHGYQVYELQLACCIVIRLIIKFMIMIFVDCS